MRLLVRGEHLYTDYARHVDYQFMPGQIQDVPDDVAGVVAEAHPTKFCLLASGETAENHRCSRCYTAPSVELLPVPTPYKDTEMVLPPANRQMRSRKRSKQ